MIVNADALQVFENWRVVTARPSPEDEARAPHLLYGHIPGDQDYSVGHWLREVAPILQGPKRPIIVGGTGLNLTALTEGLADIPLTPPAIRKDGEARFAEGGLPALLADLDPDTMARIDTRNPARVARAWEVQHTTGRGLASWQDDTPPPLLPLSSARAFHLDAERDWLRDRIERRFDIMLDEGALEEAPPEPFDMGSQGSVLESHRRARVDRPTCKARYRWMKRAKRPSSQASNTPSDSAPGSENGCETGR